MPNLLPRVAHRFLKDVSGVWRSADTRTASRYTLALLTHAPEILRTRKLVAADHALAATDSSFAIAGTHIRLGGELFAGAREMYCRAVYFQIPEVTLAPDDCVVDLGANAGLFSLVAARVCKRVISVEAQASMLELIEANMRRNDCRDRATIVHALVGGSRGVFASATPPGLGQRRDLSDILAEAGAESVGFLKMDIEGSEFALFAGDTSRWLPRVDRIAMEVHSAFGDPEALARQLEENGFQVWRTDPDSRRVARLQSDGYLFARRRRRT